MGCERRFIRLQSRIQACTQTHTLCFHTHAHMCTCGSALRWQSPGRAWDSWHLSCLVSVGTAGEGQGRVPDVCLRVAALPSCRALRGWGRGVRISTAQAHGDRSQKHGWLPIQPERWGGMSDWRAACVLCRGVVCTGCKAVLCLAGPGSSRSLAYGCWELGWRASSLHVAAQPHPASLPPYPRT